MERQRQPRRPCLTLTSPYAEGAIVAIARAALARRQLKEFVTTLYWGEDVSPMILGGRLSRRRLAGVPNRLVWQVARPMELAFVISKHLGRRRIAADLMYRTKKHFDRAAAREITRRRTDVVVGMFGAALETFEAAHDAHNACTILHFVNSHPRVHNRLLEKAGAPAGSSEYVPHWVTERVNAELRLADLVLVPSLFVMHQLVEEGVALERLALLRYGVDSERFAPTPPVVAERKKLKCLYVGQISWRKGIRVLVDAARILDGFAKFELIGPLVSREVLRDVPPNVKVRNTVSHAELRDEYRRADAFVLPSIEDAFPLVTLEALSSGLPVVVSDGAGTSELITNGRDGLVVPAGNSTALASAVMQLADPRVRADLGNAGRCLVAQSHSWEDYGLRVLSALDGLPRAA
jgi:glycosyltransferase involved in cell wall biosynthesis